MENKNKDPKYTINDRVYFMFRDRTTVGNVTKVKTVAYSIYGTQLDDVDNKHIRYRHSYKMRCRGHFDHIQTDIWIKEPKVFDNLQDLVKSLEPKKEKK